MPEISRFYGIIIRMYPGDHPPPHFHAVYAEDEAFVEIENRSPPLRLLAGHGPALGADVGR
jgi:Domain of unknown function (DUF4160)